MAFTAADLRMVDDHIAQGERHVTRQAELLAWLGSRGHPTEMAEQLLVAFQSTLEQHRAHREVMLAANEIPMGRTSRPGPAPRRAS
jgi:hypothetical protein